MATRSRKQKRSVPPKISIPPTSDEPAPAEATSAATSTSDSAASYGYALHSATEPPPQPILGATAGEQVTNVLKLVADLAIIPGSGQLVEGKIGEGVMYGLAGVAAKIISPLFGPLFWVPWVFVGLDSFSKSAAGKHLWEPAQPSAAPPSVPQEPGRP